MEFFKPGLLVDFMRHRLVYLAVSGVAIVASLVSVAYPGLNYGIDFAGGTEVQLAFPRGMTSAELRQTLEAAGYSRPDVVAVAGSDNEYIVRIAEVSALSAEQRQRIEQAVRGLASDELEILRVSISPGGDKVSVELSADVDPTRIQSAVEGAGATVVRVERFGEASDHRYEVQLEGVAQEMMQRLTTSLADRAPSEPRRIEWVGPRAGQQLRDAAIQAVLYALAFIMVYVAFRFDLRFAPGGVIALAHDCLITIGVFVLLQKEFNLTIVAAILTIAGYSINDTIVIYDRIRENMGRYRDKSLYDVINISTSQTLSRTVITSGTTLLSIAAFFFFGTSTVRDISFALFIGITIGTYSSIFVAAPITEGMDKAFVRKIRGRAKKPGVAKRQRASA